jgi:GT2 family glycosyltransferase
VGFAEAIARLDPAPGALLAVDDGSGDGTAERLAAAGFEVISHRSNLGLGAARNSLWRRCEELGFQVAVFLDADVHPPPDYLRRVCALLGQERIAGVGGRNLEQSPATRADRWRARFWPQELGSIELMDAPMLVGACASYRISALRDVGGFDVRHRSHGEDVDLGRRMRARGHRLRYDPAIAVHHTRQDTEMTLVRGCYRHCREGMRATLRTPGSDPQPISLVVGMARKLVRAPLSSLVRRGDPGEALLGSAACGAGMLGYLVGWATSRPLQQRSLQ